MTSAVGKCSAPGTLPKGRGHAGVEAGELRDAVERSVREVACDLLVLGRYGRDGFAGAAIGNRAADLLVSATFHGLMVRGRA